MTLPPHDVQRATPSRSLPGLAAEVAFAVLPLLVVFMALVHIQRPERMFLSPEWSFGTAVLFGQSLVKFIAGLARGGQAASGAVALAVALVVVFGLVPSLFVLSVVFETVEAAKPVAVWLQALQVVLFAAAAVVYMTLGAVGENWRARKAA